MIEEKYPTKPIVIEHKSQNELIAERRAKREQMISALRLKYPLSQKIYLKEEPEVQQIRIYDLIRRYKGFEETLDNYKTRIFLAARSGRWEEVKSLSTAMSEFQIDFEQFSQQTVNIKNLGE